MAALSPCLRGLPARRVPPRPTRGLRTCPAHAPPPPPPLSLSRADGGRPVRYLNELEWVGGLIYANVWTTNCLAVIDPATGAVRAWVDMQARPAPPCPPSAACPAPDPAPACPCSLLLPVTPCPARRRRYARPLLPASTS